MYSPKATDSADLSFNTKVSAYLVSRQMTVSIYFLTPSGAFNGPTRSIATVANGVSEVVYITKGGIEVLVLFKVLHTMHLLIYFLTLLFMICPFFGIYISNR